MQVQTKTGHFKCTPEALLNLLSKEENLPKWATLFCQAIKMDGDDYKITTPMGELFFRIDVDIKTGVIDMKAGPTKKQMGGGYHRVVSDNNGGSLFLFTHLQSPGESDEQYLEGCSGIDKEFEVIRELVENK